MSTWVTVLTAGIASLVTGVATVSLALRKRGDERADRADDRTRADATARAAVDVADATGRHAVEIERVKADAALQVEAIRLAPNLIAQVTRLSDELGECNAKHEACLTEQAALCARVTDLEAKVLERHQADVAAALAARKPTP